MPRCSSRIGDATDSSSGHTGSRVVGAPSVPGVAYDEELAERVRGELAGLLPGEDVDERRMFGGLAFLVGGSLAVAVSGQGGLMVRVDPAEAEALLREPGVEQVVMGARGPVRGWLRATPDAVGDGAALRTWLRRGAARARTAG